MGRDPRPSPAWRDHWPEYASEAAGLGLFMVAACACAVLLGHPSSPLARAVSDLLARRALMGLGMGLTAIGLIRSPWGQRSGAHFNPATTLTFWRLGKIAPADALAYAIAQSLGGLAGVGVAWLALRDLVAHPSVRYVATVPGPGGAWPAFAAEALMAFLLMTVVLRASNAPGLARFTPFFAGALVAFYIAVEAPISGMSLNPARSLASALPAGAAQDLWIYVIAPPLGMLVAAECYVRQRGLARVFCAKLDHDHGRRCIFRCRYGDLAGGADRAPAPSPQPVAVGRHVRTSRL